MSHPDPEALLVESAPLAWKLAPQLCRKDPATGENCSWYHGIWQFLRIMGLTSSAAQRAEFYHREIRAACAGADAPRILISGTADYAMLALVIAALRNENARPAITVTDACETPLHLSRWYAERNACAIETYCGDILDFQMREPFDLVCTDGFFSRFPATRRPALAAKWKTLLRRGGRIISTNRLHPDSAGGRIGFSSTRARKFLDDARRTVEEKRDAIRIDPRELLRGAETYASKHDTYPLVSMEDVRRLLEETGFEITLLSAISRAGEQRDETTPEARKKAPLQMHLVAGRL